MLRGTFDGGSGVLSGEGKGVVFCKLGTTTVLFSGVLFNRRELAGPCQSGVSRPCAIHRLASVSSEAGSGCGAYFARSSLRRSSVTGLISMSSKPSR